MKDNLSDAIEELAESRYRIIRTSKDGSFAGYLNYESEDGKTAVLLCARRLWYWPDSPSLKDLALNGIPATEDIEFLIQVPRVELNDVLEILETSEKARISIQKIPAWSK